MTSSPIICVVTLVVHFSILTFENCFFFFFFFFFGWSVLLYSFLYRYKLLHDTFVYYENSGTSIGYQEAVNLTAVVGDKGGVSRQSFLHCANATGGSNIISATFHPASQRMFVAFEDGTGDDHVPACCGTYVEFGMEKWFH